MSLMDDILNDRANNRQSNSRSLMDDVLSDNNYSEPTQSNSLMDSILSEQKPIESPTPQPKEDKEKSFFGTVGGMIGALGKNVGTGLKHAGHLINPFDDVGMKEIEQMTREQNKKDEQDEDWQNLANLVHSTTSGATFGTLQNPEYVKPGAINVTGKIAGAFVPGGAIATGLRGTRLGANVTPNMSIGQKGLQYAKEGAVAGAAYGTIDESVQGISNPEDFNLVDSAKRIGLEAGIGAVADPAIMGAMSGISKGANRLWNSDAIQNQNAFIGRSNNMGPMNEPDRLRPEQPKSLMDDILEQKEVPYNVLRENPINVELPSYAPTNYRVDAQFKAQADVPTTFNARKTEVPRMEQDIDNAINEYRDQVQSQIEYIQNSGGQGVNAGGLIRDELGNVVDRFGRTSNNPGWYQEFYRVNGRPPNQAEQLELAKEQVLYGFDDVGSNIPAWQPSILEDLDDQITQLQEYYRLSPTENMRNSLEELTTYRNELETALTERLQNDSGINPSNQSYNLTRRPMGYNLNVQTNAVNPQQNIMPTIQRQVDDTVLKQTEGDYNSFRSKVDREPKKKNKFSSTYQKLRTQFVDDLAPLEKFEKNIRGTVNDAENSVYKQGRLFRGSAEKSHNFVRTQIRPIIQQVESAGYKYDDLGDYALAMHAKDVNAKRMNSGFTNAEIDSVIKRFNTPEMERARIQLNNVSTQLLRVLEDAQVLEPGTADFLRQRWPNYMPLFRSFDDDKIEFGSGLSRSLANATNPIKRLEGSDRDVVDPIESMVKNTFKTFNVADRNRVGLQLTQLSSEDTAGNFIRKVDGDTSRKNVVSVLENGQKVKYEVPPEVYETITNLNQESSNLLIKMLQKPASWLRAGATLDPVFSLRNPMRDIVQAYVVSNSKFNPIVDFPIGLFNAIFKGKKVNIKGKEITLGKFYDDFVNSNGGYGNIVSMDRNLHRKALQQGLNDKSNVFVNVLNPSTYMNVLRSIADASENAIKIGEFRAAKKKRGVSNEEAAYRARDIMDFNRAGTSIREANKVIAFLNANIQGKSRLIRAIVGNPVRTTVKALTSVGLPTIAFYAAYQSLSNEKQRTTIEDAPQWMKETFWLTPIPGTDMVARIPKPFDLTFVSNSLERALEYAVENDKHAFDGFVKELARGQALPVMMTGLAPFVEGIANYSFFMGGPVIPQRENSLEYPDQHDINTTGTARFIAEQINKVTGGEGTFKNFGSPRIVDNTIRGLTAGLGTYATSAVDSIFFDDYYEKPEKATKDFVTEQTPVRGFVVNEMSSGQSMSELYDLRDQLRRQKGSAKQGNELFNDGARLNYVESVTKQISDISKVMRNIENDTNMQGEQKRTRLEELNQRRNEIARQAWENVR